MDVLITFDTDAVNQNNRHGNPSNPSFDYDDELKWIADNVPVATIFTRIDYQVNLYNKVRSIMPHFEMAWHPHVYMPDLSPCKDEETISDMIVALHETYEINMNCVRMGHAQGGNHIIKTLHDLGFRADSSALPGRKSNDAGRFYDWERTGCRPYFPSRNDYQVSGDDVYDILEVPMTTIPMLASYDKAPVKRYVNPLIRPEVFQPALQNCGHLECLVVIFHPDELIEGHEDGLYLYGKETFTNNMKFVSELFQNHKTLTMTEYEKKWR